MIVFMKNTIYFKDISNCDKNNYPNKIYRVEHSKMLIEILDDQHIQGSAQYFSSIRSRNNFIDSIKNNILKISIDELKKIQHYWKIKIQTEHRKTTYMVHMYTVFLMILLL